MHFSYILSGWEGSASDCDVYQDACGNDFTIAKGKYYLANAGYGICDTLLVPFQGVWYHLREWEASGLSYVILSFPDLQVMTSSKASNLQGAVQPAAFTSLQHHRAYFWSYQKVLPHQPKDQ
jgi:hypothetical protein